ncbi:hypothetical protein FYK55_17410 [Roseiconus nitratireducens]|uniref:Uncharacterized protein n=1 Tax=Roseiconus nitratireducens TaxID=2605748 RepID=A0A5M6D1G4_9BACT|nr:hypothetical protein [Roseiconus nitratireducens]KAA5541351.1 hypothetical protein FYK55_17410 [Roseiconus nitratireducens]
MPSTPSDLLQTLAKEKQRAHQQIEHLRSNDVRQSRRLRRLTEQRAGAFVNLARHYLPTLGQQHVTNAWKEVRDEIGQILRERNERVRFLQDQIDRARQTRTQLIRQRDEATKSLDRERLILSCKTGNFEKVMRDDPAVSRCMSEIKKLDQEMQRRLDQLEQVQQDARKKLPAYEQCQLFQYLRSQKFGTPEYRAGGVERRWDRWVAKLIGFQKANSGYEFLTQAPGRLAELIEEKQQRYRLCLRELESARERAKKMHGVDAQTNIWRSHSKRVRALDLAIEQSEWHLNHLTDECCELESLNGAYYDRAIKVFKDFLQSLEPEILTIYASCTESPADDAICERLRQIHDQIETQRRGCDQTDRRVQTLKAYASGLAELQSKLREHLRCLPDDVRFSDRLCLNEQLRRLSEQRRTPAEIWRRIRRSIIATSPERQDSQTGESAGCSHRRGRQFDAVEAAFAAAATPPPDQNDQEPPDDVGIVLPRSSPDDATSGYASIAICRSGREASHIRELLEGQGITCFTCQLPYTATEPTEQGQSLEHHVMAPSSQFNSARRFLTRRRNELETPWYCAACDSEVRHGYLVCHQCGATKP